MRTATVVACRNTICSQGTPADVPVAPPARNEMLLRGKATTQAYIEATSAGYLVEVIFPLDDSSPAVNGDTYELHVKDANGASLGDVTGKAAYTDTAPNGKDCPPVCKNATIS